MLKSVLATAAMAASAVLAAPTFAQAKENKIAIPPVLKAAEGYAGLTVVKDFKAAGGLQGWVVNSKAENKNIVVYTTADGQILLGGIALDKTGKNLTAEYSELHVPPPDHSAAFKDFTQEGASAGVVIGAATAKAEITVLFDANCGFCKIMHGLTKPAVDSGQLRVRYVPVAILGADSGPKGAAMLATDNAGPLVDVLANGGRIQVSNDQALLSKVKANTDLMRKHGFNGTPAVFYTGTRAGKQVQMVANGVPTMSELFTALGVDGKLEQLQQDPKLRQYAR